MVEYGGRFWNCYIKALARRVGSNWSITVEASPSSNRSTFVVSGVTGIEVVRAFILGRMPVCY